ncbi:hypothetical protein FRB99_004582 [Tulasnella sp. 403]|nr:hypothetical protein FRB99_004582 [Tulasnella sp. 403]
MRKQLILPFNAPSLREGSGVTIEAGRESVACGMCGHSQCSEPFYKTEVESEIYLSEGVKAEDKAGMMQILQRFEEEAQRDEEDREDDDDGDDDDLAKRLEGIDLDTANPATILSLLSPSQRQAFEQLVRNPHSEKVKELLDSDKVGSVAKLWWEDEGRMPEMIVLPDGLMKSPPPATRGSSLLFNVFAICIAYTSVSLTLLTSPLSIVPNSLGTARDLISQLIPFLSNHKSTTAFPSIGSAWLDVVSRLPPPQSSTHLRTVLKSTLALLQPTLVTLSDMPSPLECSPRRRTLLALSDLSQVFGEGGKANHVTKKLAFYAAFVYFVGDEAWSVLVEGVIRRLGEIEKEVEEDEHQAPIRRKPMDTRPLIQEL